VGVLVAYSGSAAATATLARRLAEGLQGNGIDAVAVDVEANGGGVDLARFRAVVVVGARRWGRWPRSMRRFLRAQRAQLRRLRVWLVSAESKWPGAGGRGSGVPFRHVCNLLAAVGAEGHARFDPSDDDDARVASWSRDIASFLVLQGPPEAPPCDLEYIAPRFGRLCTRDAEIIGRRCRFGPSPFVERGEAAGTVPAGESKERMP
jgi:hypothetical protein